MRFNSIVTIAKPREMVWKVITNPATWKTWYGGELRKADPAWQKGARLVWAAGSTTEITEFTPLELIGFGDSVRCRISLTDGEDGSTVLEYSESVGGHLSVSDPSAKQAQCNSTARGLKTYAESSRGMGRIVIGILLVLAFLAGLFGNPPSMLIYILLGTPLFLLPGGLFIMSGLKVR